jgi:hypothetical protein
MVLAIDLHQQEAPKEFSSYTVYAHRKLVQFVENRKDLTAQSYRFFVEHAYNPFFQHEAFHQSTSSRTKARDLDAGEFHIPTRLDGYIWVANTSKISHVPNDQADDVDMEDDDENETQASHFLKVTVRSREEEKNKGGVSSLQKEETQKREEVSSKHDGITAPTQHRKRSS